MSSGFAGVDHGFVDKSIEIDGEKFLYQVFVPYDWTSVEEWPVVLYLHGRGESGSDGKAQASIGIAAAVRRNPSQFPAVVVMPQCRRGAAWNDPRMEQLAFGVLDRAIRDYNGDPQRVYLSGLSMGGYGTFYFGGKYPDRFAALVPVCGGIVPPNRSGLRSSDGAGDPYAEAARKIGRTPIWIFHGAADPVVPVSESRKMVDALKALGNSVKYTEYPGVGHNSWDRAYSEQGLIGWMLSQRR